MRTTIHLCSSVCAKMLKLLKSTFLSVVMAGTQESVDISNVSYSYLVRLQH